MGNIGDTGKGGGRVGRLAHLIDMRGWRWRRVVTTLLIGLAGYAAADVFMPLDRDPARFDPIATGTLEATIWREYYDKRHVALFLDLAQLLHVQYRFPLVRSYVGAFYGATAAFRFKEGKVRSDYEQALPALRIYFALARNTMNRHFDVRRTAALELEWWIVHREHERYGREALGRACAEAAASIYQVPVGSLLEYGQLRADAMLLRDAREEAGRVTEPDWAAIEATLHRGYVSLSGVLARTGGAPG